MFDKENTEQILNGIVWLNEKLGIWSFIIPIIFALSVLISLFFAYTNPNKKNTKIVLGIYAIIYLFSGYSIFIGKDFMGLKVALGGAIGLWFVCFMLILDIIFKWTVIQLSEDKFLRIVSLFLILGGIFLYPIVEILTGFTYPRMVFFGAECPTTISLIGIFIGSVPKINRPLFIIISLNAIFTGLSVAISGAVFDYFYAFSGIMGIIVIIVYFKDIFLNKTNTNLNN